VALITADAQAAAFVFHGERDVIGQCHRPGRGGAQNSGRFWNPDCTADQFFSESQFESYRMLGAHTMDQLCTECRGDFRSFIRHILERHLEMKPSEWPAELIEP